MTATMTLGGQPETAFLVAKLNATGTQWMIDGGVGSGRNIIGDGSGSWVIYAGNFIGSTAIDTTNPHLFVATYNGVSSSLLVDSASAGSGDAGAQTLFNGITVGTAFDGSTAANMTFCELFYTSVASAGGDVTSAETYLKAKWGTP